MGVPRLTLDLSTSDMSVSCIHSPLPLQPTLTFFHISVVSLQVLGVPRAQEVVFAVLLRNQHGGCMCGGLVHES